MTTETTETETAEAGETERETALYALLDSVGERVGAAYAKRGWSNAADSVGDAVTTAWEGLRGADAETITAADAVRAVSAAMAAERRASRSAQGLADSRGSRSDVGTLTESRWATLAVKLGAGETVRLANRFTMGSVTTLERATAVLASVSVASLPAVVIQGLRKRDSGTGSVGDATLTAAHSAENAYLRQTAERITRDAVDSVTPNIREGKGSAAWANLTALSEALSANIGRSVSVADVLLSEYRAPIFRVVKGLGKREQARGVNVTAAARRALAVTADREATAADAEATAYAVKAWARDVRQSVSVETVAAFADVGTSSVAVESAMRADTTTIVAPEHDDSGRECSWHRVGRDSVPRWTATAVPMLSAELAAWIGGPFATERAAFAAMVDAPSGSVSDAVAAHRAARAAL